MPGACCSPYCLPAPPFGLPACRTEHGELTLATATFLHFFFISLSCEFDSNSRLNVAKLPTSPLLSNCINVQPRR